MARSRTSTGACERSIGLSVGRGRHLPVGWWQGHGEPSVGWAAGP
jgi:hypothetical protein